MGSRDLAMANELTASSEHINIDYRKTLREVMHVMQAYNRVWFLIKSCSLLFPSQIRIIAAQALTTMAIRSSEPYRLQIYEFLNVSAQGGVQAKFSDLHVSNGEDQGATGTGLGSLLSPMIQVLDEMYKAQDELIK